MTERPAVSIIGPGKVGTALGRLLKDAGWNVRAVAGRHKDTARAAALAMGLDADTVCTPAQAARRASRGLCLLTVPDDAIEPLCAELAEAGTFEAGTVVAHCSGALGSEVLSAARIRCGCHVGSMHPLQTFPSVEAAVEKLPGTFFFCEGDPAAVAELERLAETIGGKPRRIDAGAKALYHASAVLACNCLTALMDAAVALAEAAGLQRGEAWEALRPLVTATLENISAAGTESALTGPIARGDVLTVERHLAALTKTDERIAGLYRAAGRWTVDLAMRKGTLDASAAGRLRELLRKDRKDTGRHDSEDH